ncbi:MAG: hypothetical protein CM15mP59_4660 [Flavobacteriaceae bacterium]|nr:MAG: hypothetical protein CM15mP59_4660 [Flavobacteriaceae bacterium]
MKSIWWNRRYYAQKNINRYGVDAQQTQLAMTKLYLFQAVEKYNPKGKKPSFHLQKGMNKNASYGSKTIYKVSNHPNVIGLRKQIADKVIAENQYCF